MNKNIKNNLIYKKRGNREKKWGGGKGSKKNKRIKCAKINSTTKRNTTPQTNLPVLL